MQLPRDKKYTYADYLTWDDDNRYELIDGEVYMMAPAPARIHQEVSVSLSGQLYNYLKGKKCKVYAAPFDVRLNADSEDNIVVQPDISVICDPNKLDDQGCKGAPDMIVEILSPSTAGRDQVLKFNKYLEAGVREYWMIYPESRTVQVYLQKNGEYVGKNYDATTTIPVSILEDCRIDLADVFPSLPPEEADTKTD